MCFVQSMFVEVEPALITYMELHIWRGMGSGETDSSSAAQLFEASSRSAIDKCYLRLLCLSQFPLLKPLCGGVTRRFYHVAACITAMRC